VSVFSPYFSFQSIFLFLSRVVHCLPFQHRLLGARVFLLLVCDAFQIYLTMPQCHKNTQTHNHTHTDTPTHTHTHTHNNTHISNSTIIEMCTIVEDHNASYMHCNTKGL